MMQQYLKELEQEPFDAEEFVERLAWRTIAETKEGGNEEFNPVVLHDSFVQAIKDLTLLQERQQKKCERLEARVQDDEAIFRKEIHGLLDSNKNAIDTFQELDGKINIVGAKVLHLGDQLDNINAPRQRVVEAQKLMTHLNGFLSPNNYSSPLFDDSTNLTEVAEIIRKLQIISQDLPSDRFGSIIKQIKNQYDDVEKALIQDFRTAQTKNDYKKMKEIAGVLSQFKSYSDCVDSFIVQSQKGCLSNKDVFLYMLNLCKNSYEIIKQVFNNPEQVISKYVLNLYHSHLQMYIQERLSITKLDTYNYLKVLYDLYSRTLQLSSNLESANMSDKSFLEKLTNNIYKSYIENYINLELDCLKGRLADVLKKYYESKNHQKRQLHSGGFQELRRDIQAAIGTRTNLNIAQIENYGGETFLSEELAITVLQDSKLAFQRCLLLSKSDEKASNAVRILDELQKYLLIDHIAYAIELGLQSIPVVEGPKIPPNFYFFTVIHQSNNIIHLLEKQFVDLVVPLVTKSPEKYSECLQMKKQRLEEIEKKVNIGFDRCLTAIVTWVKLYLQSEQKKSDFKPDTDDINTVASNACRGVTQYITNTISQITNNLDGNNVVVILQELGIKLHKVIYEHLLQFQYNTLGGMIVICDLNEYRSCTKPLGPLVAKLFETLHALCNLLLVKPENLDQVREDSLVDLDPSIVNSFIQLRSDAKILKLRI
ncbi:exocyst complex component 5 [Onthophagus taurus]|uniref:exocyst complex component 5 n=1 Tax=Onthophagus taurus TaxID=166361 RepID=UPI000C1FDFC6|nr:exocyst complex component 5 [Onthophagus taurus]